MNVTDPVTGKQRRMDKRHGHTASPSASLLFPGVSLPIPFLPLQSLLTPLPSPRSPLKIPQSPPGTETSRTTFGAVKDL